MLATKLKAQACPACGKLLDAASSIMDSERGPRNGDYTVCLYCAAILRYTKSMNLAPVTSDEILELRNEEPESFRALMKMVIAIRQFQRERAERN